MNTLSAVPETASAPEAPTVSIRVPRDDGAPAPAGDGATSGAAEEPVVRFENVHFYYSQFRAVKDVSIDIAPRRMTIETDAGVIGAEIQESAVTLTLPAPRDFVAKRPLETPGGMVAEGSFIIVGVPHFVTYVVGDLWSRDVEPLGRTLRHHKELAPNGANVNFVSVESRSSISVRTYERGVEAETLSCGSGVVASSCVSALLGLVDRSVTVLTRSGIRYTVEMESSDKAGSPAISQVKLTGDARLVYKSQLTAETIEGFDADWVRAPTAPGPRP